ncbi:MAG: hypothetical protein FJ087_00660 [Deltaproteobacteria bacterium]|nr:hypothetical protein [Deltaproteobacteria bacterium]
MSERNDGGSPPGSGGGPPHGDGAQRAGVGGPRREGGRPPGRGPERGRATHPPRSPAGAKATPEEKAKAQQVVERSGIPLPQAILVVRGQVTLNDVLKEMLAREKVEKLVKEGFDRSLAGQVAHGRLDLERARRIQKVWTTQNASFHSDRMKDLPVGAPVMVSLFDAGAVRGLVQDVSRYDLVLRTEAGPEPVTVKKHDIKFYCALGYADRVLASVGRDAEVAALGLKASTSLADRFRPEDALVLQWVPSAAPKRLVLRDGDALTGVPVRIARYEIELDVGDGATVCVLTHALLRERPFV